MHVCTVLVWERRLHTQSLLTVTLSAQTTDCSRPPSDASSVHCPLSTVHPATNCLCCSSVASTVCSVRSAQLVGGVCVCICLRVSFSSLLPQNVLTCLLSLSLPVENARCALVALLILISKNRSSLPQTCMKPRFFKKVRIPFRLLLLYHCTCDINHRTQFHWGRE